MGLKVALLRAVNVGGRKLPMAGLRELCAELGWKQVATYIQSGNVVFEAAGGPEALETALERAIEKRFGMRVPVMVRSASQLRTYLDENPFPKAARDAPNWLLLLVAKQPPAKGAEAALTARAMAGEQVGRAGDGLWICYPKGVGTSKLSPVLIDRLVESPATGRNHRTVTKLLEMMER
jgi:uncharacterized protein (DUF1697 family)